MSETHFPSEASFERWVRADQTQQIVEFLRYNATRAITDEARHFNTGLAAVIEREFSQLVQTPEPDVGEQSRSEAEALAQRARAEITWPVKEIPSDRVPEVVTEHPSYEELVEVFVQIKRLLPGECNRSDIEWALRSGPLRPRL